MLTQNKPALPFNVLERVKNSRAILSLSLSLATLPINGSAEEALCKVPRAGEGFERVPTRIALTQQFTPIVLPGNRGFDRLVQGAGAKPNSSPTKVSIAQLVANSKSGYVVVVLGGELCPKALEHSQQFGNLARAIDSTPVVYSFNCGPIAAQQFFITRIKELSETINLVDPNIRLANLLHLKASETAYANTFLVLQKEVNPATPNVTNIRLVPPPPDVTEKTLVKGGAWPFTKVAFERARSLINPIGPKEYFKSFPTNEPTIGCALLRCSHSATTTR